MPEKEETKKTAAPAMPKYRERLRNRYPDANPQSDADYDGLAEQAYAEDEEKIRGYEDNNKVIEDLMDSDKDLKSVVSEMIVNGTPFRAAVAKFFDPEDLVAKEGDEDYEYYQKNAEERKKMGQAFRERAARRRANATEAYDNIDKFAKKHEMQGAEKQAFVAFVDELYDDLSDLKISMKTLEKLYKAMTYDEAVAEAAEAAEIDGKNAAIEATRAKKAAAAAGDGVPAPQAGSAPAPERPRRKSTIFDDIPKRKF